MKSFNHLTGAEKVKVVIATVLIVLFVGFPVMAAASRGTLDVGLSFGSAPFGAGSGESTTLDSALSERSSFAADEVRNLDVSWSGGSLTVKRGTSDAVEVHEEVPAGTYALDPTRATFTMRGDTLVIDDGLPDTDNGRGYPDMRLTILLPQTDGWSLEHVELAGASVHASVSDLACDSLTLSTVDAPVELAGLAAGHVELNDVNGSHTLSASAINELEVNTVSGSQTLAFGDAVPRSLRVSSVDGSTQLTLPEDAGFTVRVPDALGPDLHLRDGATQQDATTYRSGDGALDIDLDSVGGSLTVA